MSSENNIRESLVLSRSCARGDAGGRLLVTEETIPRSPSRKKRARGLSLDTTHHALPRFYASKHWIHIYPLSPFAARERRKGEKRKKKGRTMLEMRPQDQPLEELER